MKTCSVSNCLNKDKLYSYYKLPEDEEKASKWKISMKNLASGRQIYVCSKHFRASDFHLSIATGKINFL